MTAPVNEFSDAFSTAFDPAASPPPPGPITDPTYCWPVDVSCCEGWDEVDTDGNPLYPVDVQERAMKLAAMTLRMLTGYRVGGCPITVRPCRKPCAGGGTYAVAPLPGTNGGVGNPWIGPVLWRGQWINIACNCTGVECSCGPLCEVYLPGPVGRVDEVTIDGVTLDPTAYRVDNGHLLVRQDGDCWPVCQDMAVPLGEPDTFGITYLNAVEVDSLGAFAAGQLACEYAKACLGRKCALPSNVTRVVRHGIALDLSTGVFPNNQTGIREVDAWVRRWNPNHLIAASTVWSPDLRQPRHTHLGG